MRRRLNGWPARLGPHLLYLVPELLIAAGPFVIASIARAGERPRFRMPDFFYGGQALVEGVMMRGRTTVAMSVRPPDGAIRTYSEPLPRALARGRWAKVPLARGVLVLYEALVIGTRMLMRSAAIATEASPTARRPTRCWIRTFTAGKSRARLAAIFSISDSAIGP